MRPQSRAFVSLVFFPLRLRSFKYRLSQKGPALVSLPHPFPQPTSAAVQSTTSHSFFFFSILVVLLSSSSILFFPLFVRHASPSPLPFRVDRCKRKKGRINKQTTSPLFPPFWTYLSRVRVPNWLVSGEGKQGQNKPTFDANFQLQNWPEKSGRRIEGKEKKSGGETRRNRSHGAAWMIAW